ncbi:transmembrane protein 160 [Paramormyrops kingsleyae]|uniref:Transmembrane protein 160 n=1 Tax=Paramormyrops kingsleyae TaxID=1676925 RepID=A0A3B3SD72_9TELE|nr:transmembrane protein 160 [Paramormyrops kingsleyae]
MAAFSWFACGRLSRAVLHVGRRVAHSQPPCPRAPRRWVSESPRVRVGEKGALGKARAAEQPHFTELDKADALMLRKSHETGFLSWFRNGLLATGVGVIAFVQSDVGREAGYAFFILGGVCVSFGAASYVANLFSLRRIMLLSMPAVLINSMVVGSMGLLWLSAVSLYIGRLEVEIIHEEDEEARPPRDCDECGDRRDERHPEDKGRDK